MVASCDILASAKDVIFRDPSSFVPGELHNHYSEWERIAPPGQAQEVLSFIRNGVDVWQYIQPFKGTFNGKQYDSPFPPPQQFPNSPSCVEFKSFIDATIKERVRTGSLLFWGLVGQAEPPHLVMPITIEPQKPRMCHDERFLNLWIRDLPFTLDYLSDLPRYLERGHFQTVCDDKSGYDHLMLTQSSRTMFGLCWDGCYFVYVSLPFGWKASAYIYHSTGQVATSYIRSLNVPCSQYIDDRHNGQLVTAESCSWSNLEKAEAAIYIVTSVLTALGYTITLSKSSLMPAQCVRFLGYLVNTLLMAFVLPDDKIEKFKILRESILLQHDVDIKTLQRFAGKTTSFAIAVPAARLHTRVVYRAISSAATRSVSQLEVKGKLRKEIAYWRFLDTWSGHLPWLDERHLVIKFHVDASNTGWGGIVFPLEGATITLRDYWQPTQSQKPIVIKEALALLYTITAAASHLSNCRIDAHSDSLSLVQSWRNQGGRCAELTEIITAISDLLLRLNIGLSLHHIPSGENEADAPSRALSPNDCMLAESVWQVLQHQWGPHTIDLMSLDSNVHKGQDGSPLPHFTPWPTPDSAGVNFFAQSLSDTENAYIFPPLAVVGPALRLLLERKYSFTMVLPDVFPHRFWWAIANGRANEKIRLGCRGQLDILLFPSRPSGFISKPLEYDLWAFRF